MKDVYAGLGEGGGLLAVVRLLRGSLGREIRARRTAAGASQARLARAARVRKETVSRIENGHGNPTLGMAFKLLRAVEGLEK